MLSGAPVGASDTAKDERRTQNYGAERTRPHASHNLGMAPNRSAVTNAGNLATTFPRLLEFMVVFAQKAEAEQVSEEEGKGEEIDFGA